MLIPFLIAASPLPATACPPRPVDDATAEAVTSHYVELAHARYQDSFAQAQELLAAIRAFLESPSRETQDAAKEAWLAAHITYSHSEVLRFGNPNVDAWEGHVNAWPMDEGLIDYVADGYVHHEGNPYARTNLIVEGRMMITDDLIAEYRDGSDPKAAASANITDVESNVTTGYHAIEFLLWGQDLNVEPGTAGLRPYTDYVVGEGGTHGPTSRRRDYLSAAARLLLTDLRFMLYQWTPEKGRYTREYQALPLEERLRRMTLGLGSLSFAEVASERVRVALITSDQEEEQSCFSDTSLEALLANVEGIESMYLGRHVMASGKVVEGPSVADLVVQLDPELDRQLRGEMRDTIEFVAKLVEAGQPLDELIPAENEAGREQLRRLMELLRVQTVSLEAVHGMVPQLAKL